MPHRADPRAVVADDDVDVRPLIALTLRRAGFTVEACGNGVDALSTIQRLRPDIAVLDLTMPGLSGVEVIEQIRSDEALQGCRTLLLTGHRSEDLEALESTAAADAYLAKPFSPRELLGRVEDLIARSAH